jgi:hypothetical protein
MFTIFFSQENRALAEWRTDMIQVIAKQEICESRWSSLWWGSPEKEKEEGMEKCIGYYPANSIVCNLYITSNLSNIKWTTQFLLDQYFIEFVVELNTLHMKK